MEKERAEKPKNEYSLSSEDERRPLKEVATKTCKNDCSYFRAPLDLSRSGCLFGKCINENSDHYEHILGLKHLICLGCNPGEIK